VCHWQKQLSVYSRLSCLLVSSSVQGDWLKCGSSTVQEQRWSTAWKQPCSCRLTATQIDTNRGRGQHCHWTFSLTELCQLAVESNWSSWFAVGFLHSVLFTGCICFYAFTLHVTTKYEVWIMLTYVACLIHNWGLVCVSVWLCDQNRLLNHKPSTTKLCMKANPENVIVSSQKFFKCHLQSNRETF